MHIFYDQKVQNAQFDKICEENELNGYIVLHNSTKLITFDKSVEKCRKGYILLIKIKKIANLLKFVKKREKKDMFY